MPAINALIGYWNEYPPVNETFAAFVGYGEERAKQSGDKSATPTKTGKGERSNITVDSAAAMDAAVMQMAILGGGSVTRSKKKK